MLIQLLVDSLYEVNGHLVTSAVIEVAQEGAGNIIKVFEAIFWQMRCVNPKRRPPSYAFFDARFLQWDLTPLSYASEDDFSS